MLLGLDADAVCIGTYCPTIWRSVDRRGATWSPLPADAGGVRLTVGGPTGEVWRQAEVPATLLGGTNHVVGDVQFDPITRTRIVMAGRAGIWRSGDSGAIWYPVVRGLAMTFHGQPSADLADGGSVVVPTADWSLFSTDDSGRTVVSALDAPMEMGTSARAADWTGPGSAPLYVGGGFGTPRSELFLHQPGRRGSPRWGSGLRPTPAEFWPLRARDISGQRVLVAIAWGRGPGGAWVTDRGPARRRPPLRAGRTGRS